MKERNDSTELIAMAFKYILTPLLVLSLFSCIQYHESFLKQEEGVVIAKQFRGEVNETGSTVGISTNGDFSFGTIEIHESEKFDVVFKCNHGVIFTIDNPDIYAKLKEGDSVIIDYTEILDEENKVHDFNFIDANKIN